MLERTIARDFVKRKLYPWQKHVHEQSDCFAGDCIIQFVLDTAGKTGKTTFFKTLEHAHDAHIMPPSTTYEDIAQSILTRLKTELYLFDMPKDMHDDDAQRVYANIQRANDELLKQDCLKPFVFGHVLPDFSQLCRASWNLWTLQDYTLVPMQL